MWSQGAWTTGFEHLKLQQRGKKAEIASPVDMRREKQKNVCSCTLQKTMLLAHIHQAMLRPTLIPAHSPFFC